LQFIATLIIATSILSVSEMTGIKTRNILLANNCSIFSIGFTYLGRGQRHQDLNANQVGTITD